MSYGHEVLFSKNFVHFVQCEYIKMENNYETLRMPELKALATERKLRGYSRLRKAELIAFLQKDEEDKRQEEPTQQLEFEVPQSLAVALTKDN